MFLELTTCQVDGTNPTKELINISHAKGISEFTNIENTFTGSKIVFKGTGPNKEYLLVTESYDHIKKHIACGIGFKSLIDE